MEIDKEEEETEEGQEVYFTNSLYSELLMYRDWVLSFLQSGCSCLLRQYLKAPSLGAKAQTGVEVVGWERTHGGSLTGSGMTGLRRCSVCLWEVLEDSYVEEVQLNKGLVGVLLAELMCPPGTLGRTRPV